MAEKNKTLIRGLMLLIVGAIVGTFGNYLYANKTKVKAFVLGLKKQTEDIRDYFIDALYPPIDESINPIAPTVDLRPKCPPVYVQAISDCTANAGVAARIMLSDLKVNLSRLHQYYDERMIEGDVSSDDGAQMRDIGKALLNYGVCEESYFPYVVSNYANAPSPEAVANAEKYKISGYYALTTLEQIRQTIFQSQKPVLAGIEVYENFRNIPANGMMPMPSGQLLGYHAILICGYSDEGKYLICRNSWGSGFGLKGYFLMPFDYVNEGHASDFWYLDL